MGNIVVFKRMILLIVGQFMYGTGWVTAQSYPVKILTTNPFGDSRHVLEVTQINATDMSFKLSFLGPPAEERSFTLVPYSQASFIANFPREALSMSPASNAIMGSDVKDPAKMNILAASISTASNVFANVTTKPLAGKLVLRKEVPIRQYSRGQVAEIEAIKGTFEVREVKEGETYDALIGKSIEPIKADKDGFVVMNKLTKPYAESGLFSRPWLAENFIQHLAEERLADKYQDIIVSKEDSLAGILWRLQLNKATNQSNASGMQSLQAQLAHARAFADKIDSVSKSADPVFQKLKTIAVAMGLRITKESMADGWEAQFSTFDLMGRPKDVTLTSAQAVGHADGTLPIKQFEHIEKVQFLQLINSMVKKIQDSGKPITLDANGQKAFDSGIAKSHFKDIVAGKKVADLTETDLLKIKSFAEADTVKTFEAIEASRELVTYLLKLNEILQSESHLKTSPDATAAADSARVKTRIQNLGTELFKLSTLIPRIEDSIVDLQARIKSANHSNPVQLLRVDEVKMEFNSGFIETIVVVGSLRNGDVLKFANVMPMGFSRAKDYDDVKNHLLWSQPPLNQNMPQYYMSLALLIENYIQEPGVNRRDFSPADQKRNFMPQANTSYDLYKEETKDLFDARVYTDFVGFDAKSPNGLIQTEVGKRIPLATNRIGWRFRSSGGIHTRKRQLMYQGFHYKNIGWLNYTYPVLTWSKIEKGNRALQLGSVDRVVNNTYFQERYASTLDLRNYEYMSVGADLNVFTCDMPSFKSTFTFDLGFRYGRTQVIDSIRAIVAGVPENTHKANDFGVNTYRYYPKVSWEIKAEERYGMSMSWQWNQYHLWNADVTQVAIGNRYLQFDENKHPFGYGTVGLHAWFNPSPDNPASKVFFRYTFNHQGTRFNTNFHQAQVGVYFNVVGRSK